jgi:hypothetical protein
MSKVIFTRWLALFGVLGGVSIAILLPMIVLVYGTDISGWGRVILVVLGLGGGVVLATASVVVGITIPTAITDGGLDLNRLTSQTMIGSCCAEPVENDSEAAGEPDQS